MNRNRIVTFKYFDKAGFESVRTIVFGPDHPGTGAKVTKAGNTILVCKDIDKDELRSFRLDALEVLNEDEHPLDDLSMGIY